MSPWTPQDPGGGDWKFSLPSKSEMTYHNGLFSTFAFIGFLMCAAPLPWHIKTWNTGTCLYIFWTGLACLNQFINSVVWTGNTINRAPVWCDISSKFIIGVSTAIPAASLCINRGLYHVASTRAVTNGTKSDKRRAIMVDLAIGLGLPILAMALHFIIQDHRFYILEDVGCYPSSYYVGAIYPILLLPPIIIGLFSATYAILAIIAYKRRPQINTLLSSNNPMTANQFFRLICLASVAVLFTIAVSLYDISVTAAQPLNPWISWHNVHRDFSTVMQFSAAMWRESTQGTSLDVARWSLVFYAFVFFTFFVSGAVARKDYRYTYQSVAKCVGISMGSNGMESKVLQSSGEVHHVPPPVPHGMLPHKMTLDK